MTFTRSDRVKSLPPYLFAGLERTVEELKAEGRDLISFGVGDPDLPPPRAYLEYLREEASDPKAHNYSFSRGEREYREAVSEWYRHRFNVNLDPDREVAALIGSKEGLANIARAFINPGDKVLVPDPAYPVYRNGATLLSDGVPVTVPLLESEGFRPQLGSLDPDAKMIYLNYPNNPTGAVVDEKLLRELVDHAREKNLIICYDNAYSEIAFDGLKPPSILQIPGAMDVAIEFHSCSKTLSITGDRIGFAAGNSDLVAGLIEVKSQIDSGPPVYVQRAAARALEAYGKREVASQLQMNLRAYKERGDLLAEGLNRLGLACVRPKATFYVWARCGTESIRFAEKLLSADVVVTPGLGFGRFGEGYVRFALTIPKERIKEALERLNKIL
ncbi:MAG: aminotransferase class I/II-fold pyridoxal phosphate-dependent enzyme [Candidatus Bathyarchaeia archaeon]